MEKPELNRSEKQDADNKFVETVNGVVETFPDKTAYRKWLEEQLAENNR